MPDVPTRTGLPYLLDVNLSNTLDLHIASTNFTKAATDYSNALAAIYVWNFTKSTVDPITKQAQFFADLNDSILNLKNNIEGSINGNIASVVDGYNLSKMDTLLKPTEVWIRDQSGSIESVVVLDERREYRALDLFTSSERWVPFTPSISNIQQVLESLKEEWGINNLDDEFILFWREKFDKAHDKVKELYKELIPDDIDDSFSHISDSVGIISRASESVEATSIPLFDINFESIGTIPNSIPPSVFDKLDDDTKINVLEVSKKTNTLFRLNISKILNTITVPTQSHGENITGDYLHWSRINASLGNLNSSIAENLGATYRIFTYLQLAKNEQKTVPVQFDLVVENSIHTVDFAMNRVKKLERVRTDESILKST